MTRMRVLTHLIAATAVFPFAAMAHEGFLPLHEHGSHDHSHEAHDHASDGKGTAHDHRHAHGPENRWAVATGTRYTRHSVEGQRADLWEMGLGVDYAILPWLHVGGDFSYGWFDSKIGDTSGWMIPHAHLDVHLPIGKHWELLMGLEVGFPGGDEDLVGDHWEWEPHLEIRYDRGPWYAVAGASLAWVVGEDHAHDHAGEDDHHEEEDHAEEEHGHEGELEHGHEEHGDEGHAGHSEGFHEIVDPHGNREFHFYGAFGVRLLDERLTVETRLSGVHVLSDDTADRNYLRAGLRTSWRVSDRFTVTTDGSIPLTDAERNNWQASVGLRFEF